MASLLQRMHQHVQLSLSQQGKSGETDDGLELGICYIEAALMRVTFVGARFSLFHSRDGEVGETKSDKTGIGYRSTAYDAVFTPHVVEAVEGTSFYMASDGLTDQIGGERHRMFGKKRFKNLLLEIRDKPMPEQKGIILRALSSYQGNERRRDDVSVIGFRI